MVIRRALGIPGTKRRSDRLEWRNLLFPRGIQGGQFVGDHGDIARTIYSTSPDIWNVWYSLNYIYARYAYIDYDKKVTS